MGSGYNLYTMRTKYHASQEDIADLLQTTQQQYSKYERGIQELPARHIITLCKHFHLSADWLLGLCEGNEGTAPAGAGKETAPAGAGKETE